ncbi:SulP family inorganic anion transporter [Roseateles koreensis]|uniref:SulP family inorganic anion transporter n=1 Tax=Roseateles koreensis TaxID=2987526 RepID=A0ABT5KRY4_9BURK|nr:SulP family inorganic anion transporter [Roseateles koreensis]MDC8785607.1 SulP family inorganic anion transporter [Roseateles koreensis]
MKFDALRHAMWQRLTQSPHLRADLLAAFVVSVLLIPQSLAYAMLAGLSPQVGLYASLLPLLAYAALGSSPVLAVGPVAVLALMIAQTLGGLPPGIGAEAGALVLAAEMGLILLLAAALRLHALAALLSVPVLQGFEIGATLSIALSQLPVLVGSQVQGVELGTLVQETWRHGLSWHTATLVFGAGACGLLLLSRRLLPPTLARLAPLIVLLGAVLLSWLLNAGNLGIKLLGSLPQMQLRFTLPLLNPSVWLALLPNALLLALMAYVSSLVVAESLARKRGERVNEAAELCGLGLANWVSAFSGGMPVAGSFSRSVLLHDAGSRTRLSGAVVALFMYLAMLLLAAPLAWLPKSVLSATILVAVLSGLRLSHFTEAWAYSRREALLMGLVMVTVLCVNLALGLGLGVLGSIALLLQRSARPHVALLGRVPGTEHYRNVDRHAVELQADVLGLRIDESLLFTNARTLSDVVQGFLVVQPQARRVLLMMSPVNSIDFSGLEALKDLHDALKVQGLRLDLSEVKGPVLDRLRAGHWERWFEGQLFLSYHQGITAGERPLRDDPVPVI